MELRFILGGRGLENGAWELEFPSEDWFDTCWNFEKNLQVEVKPGSCWKKIGLTLVEIKNNLQVKVKQKLFLKKHLQNIAEITILPRFGK